MDGCIRRHRLYFQLAYAIGLLLSGPVIDRIGTKLGYALSLLIWSFAAMAHALVKTVTGFSIARFALGLGEAGNFPAAIKTVAEWFPKRERALATGIFNAGTNVGAILAPLLVPWITLRWGWQWAFLLTVAAGLLWLALWLPMYHHPRSHPRVTREELAWIEHDPPESTTRLPWAQVIKYRQAWPSPSANSSPSGGFISTGPACFSTRNSASNSPSSASSCRDLFRRRHRQRRRRLISSRLIKHGWSINLSRKTAMLTCTCVLLVSLPLARSLDRRGLDQHRHRRSPGLVGELFHGRVRDSQASRWIGRRPRRHARIGRRMLAAKTIGNPPAHSQLSPIFIVAGTAIRWAPLVHLSPLAWNLARRFINLSSRFTCSSCSLGPSAARLAHAFSNHRIEQLPHLLHQKGVILLSRINLATISHYFRRPTCFVVITAIPSLRPHTPGCRDHAESAYKNRHSHRFA
jgi:hypothetical protein